MKLVSREYKAMLDHRRFGDRRAAVDALLEESSGLATTLARPGRATRQEGEADDRLPRHARPDPGARPGAPQAAGGRGPQYTLKCRSEDRYFAAGTDLRSGGPRRRREAGGGHRPAVPLPILALEHRPVEEGSGGGAPGTLGEEEFDLPDPRGVTHDGRSCPPDTAAPSRTTRSPPLSGSTPGRSWPSAGTAWLRRGGFGRPDPLVRRQGGQAAGRRILFPPQGQGGAVLQGPVGSARSFFEAVQRLDGAAPTPGRRPSTSMGIRAGIETAMSPTRHGSSSGPSSGCLSRRPVRTSHPARRYA